MDLLLGLYRWFERCWLGLYHGAWIGERKAMPAEIGANVGYIAGHNRISPPPTLTSISKTSAEFTVLVKHFCSAYNTGKSSIGSLLTDTGFLILLFGMRSGLMLDFCLGTME
jgi:hypothetical protein